MKNALLQKSSLSRVSRGGSWNYRAWYTRISDRDGYYASYRISFQGFRLFRTQEKS